MKVLGITTKGKSVVFTLEGGVSIEFDSMGNKYWLLNGQRHREDGPAVEWADGRKYWYRYGRFHREDGPAIEYANGYKEWYLNGSYCRNEAEFNEKLKCRF